ncbi:MAG: glycosyltransferase [Muribaculaceae bacterium]|nr:glycosyltransferase [Muribaculaceae bacterium]
MDIQPIQVDLLFETSWEVCNKIGGIYTVLSTKAKNLHKLYKDKVIFIGPDVWTSSTPSPYFIESKSLMRSWLAKAELPNGITVRVGRWDIPGKPIAILVGFNGMYAVKDKFYGEMWKRYGVDSLHAYGDYDEACAFSHAAGIVIESICKHIGIEDKNIIAHFDEWTTGMGLLYTKWKLPTVATIFTTHATSIGRSICGNGKPLYDYLSGYNGDQMASELNMESKHSLEKAAAHQADCFTTVSDVTGIECTQLLDKRPDLITPNGFEPNFVPAKSKMTEAINQARLTLLNVASKLTGKNFDENTFIIATSGRCEYRNKGIDVYLDAVNMLKDRIANRQILAFVMVPAWCGGAREDLASSLKGNTSDLLADPIITHIINNPESDPIYGRIHSLGFATSQESNLTVIYVPCYLDGRDGIFNKTYYDLLPGLDATVFPSYYEPWGYTPLESVAFGVPTITTTLSGFGQWVKSDSGDNLSKTGVAVISRTDSNYWQVATEISDTLADIAAGNPSSEQLSKAAMSTAKKADWAHFIKHYTEAFDIAIANEKKRNK